MNNGLIMSAVGDIMLGDLPACSGFGVGSMIAQHGPRFPFLKCQDVLRDSNIVVGNLEVVLSPFDPKSDHFDSTHLRAQPEAVEGLVWAGFNVLSLANNHIMQHGREAVHHTIKLLSNHGIAYTGIADAQHGVSNLAVVDKGGVRLGFLGYNFRPEQYKQGPRIDVAGSRELVLRDIEEVRGKVDFIVLSLHWGEEFIPRPSAEQVRLGREIIDAGAQIVLGHHPHILQGVEKYRGGIIAYSLGDFVFDFWQERLRRSMILRLVLDDAKKIDYEIRPVLINRQWQPIALDGEQAIDMKRKIEALEALIDENADEILWQAEVSRELAAFRRSVRRHYLVSLHRFGLRRLIANVLGILKRRLPRRK